ncbi:Aminotran-1-2 domain-containing protein [Fusarium sp. Ph1]|nr:Aminotran-1-2 domain-containing protein [Fusarium sp. Ph1]
MEAPILLRLDENNLLRNEVADFITKQLSVLPSNHLTYSTGPRGSRRLRKAVSGFLTDEFHSREPITLDDIFVTPGLTSAIDAITWSICEEGDGTLIPRPFNNDFNIGILHRSNARVVAVAYHDIDGYAGPDDVFRPDINHKALQPAFKTATQERTKIPALTT